jgi:hypothetical protein
MSSYRNISGMGITVNAGASSNGLPLDLSNFQTALTSASSIALNTLTLAALKFTSYFSVQAPDAWGVLFPVLNYFYDSSRWETIEIRAAPANQTTASIQISKYDHQINISGGITRIKTPTVLLGTNASSNTRVFGDLILDKGWSQAKIHGQRTADGALFPFVELSYAGGTQLKKEAWL